MPYSLVDCHFTPDNAKNNAVAMWELESLLTKHEMSVGFKFNHLKHHVQYYAHIINVCSSHIISSITSVSKQYLSDLKVPFDTDCMFHTKDNDNLDDSDININKVVAELQLDSATVETNKNLTGYWSVFWHQFAWVLLLETVGTWLVYPWRVRNSLECECELST